MNKKELTLISRIEEELDELGTIVTRIGKAWKSASQRKDDLYLDSVALNLHGFYSCLERIFELIAKNIDGSLPQGENWHQELLKQMMIEIKQVRPPVISKTLYSSLNDYRGFRHVVRNVYTFNISYKKLKPLVDDLADVYESIRLHIYDFMNVIKSAGE